MFSLVPAFAPLPLSTTVLHAYSSCFLHCFSGESGSGCHTVSVLDDFFPLSSVRVRCALFYRAIAAQLLGLCTQYAFGSLGDLKAVFGGYARPVTVPQLPLVLFFGDPGLISTKLVWAFQQPLLPCSGSREWSSYLYLALYFSPNADSLMTGPLPIKPAWISFFS